MPVHLFFWGNTGVHECTADGFHLLSLHIGAKSRVEETCYLEIAEVTYFPQFKMPLCWRIPKQCAGHLWYLACDMQIFTLAAFLCLLLAKWVLLFIFLFVQIVLSVCARADQKKRMNKLIKITKQVILYGHSYIFLQKNKKKSGKLSHCRNGFVCGDEIKNARTSHVA